MIGQPTETSEDVEAIPALAGRMLERLRVLDPSGQPFGRLTLSISSFVPKPWTPFQWVGFDGAASLGAKLETIKRGVGRLHNVRVLHENPREAALQALLARGDRRVADFLELAAAYEGDWRRALREWDGDADFYTTRDRSTDERLPREQILHFEEMSALVDVFMDLGVDKIRLTGGEPLLRRDLPELVRLLVAKPRLRDLAMTTNGVLLAEQTRPLKDAGLHRVTVSLDTLRPDRFSTLTRRTHHAQVLDGIAALGRVGFGDTKLDTVV